METPIAQQVEAIRKPLSREEAERFYYQGPEAGVFVMMYLSNLVFGSDAASGKPDPKTPSGMIPPYLKPTKGKGSKKRGAKPGHPGKRRTVSKDDAVPVDHPPLKQCPHCGTAVHEPTSYRRRYVEDIPEVLPVLKEHAIPRQWCPNCKKHVEPVIEEAMPKATLGHRLVALTAWQHYGLGVTLAQVLAVLQSHLHFKVSEGGLVDAWQRLARALEPWYEQIADEVKRGGVLHADETGWRIDGVNHWLWCFATSGATYYMIDRSRGSPALNRFFTDTFDGVLVTDFWAAYHAVVCADRQMCLPHLFRELASVDEHTQSPDWHAFAKKLKRLLRDALRLNACRDLSATDRERRVQRIDQRLTDLLAWESEHKDVRRIVKRLRKHREFIFAFLDYDDVPSDNNHAEREIRPAVQMRKNSYGSRTDKGAQTQAILMSIYRTLKHRGHDPLDTIVDALKTYVRTGQLPPMPA